MNTPQFPARRISPPPFAVILGTNEIASAIAIHLHRANYAVVLSHDPLPPVIRRKMAFHDALFGDAVTLENVSVERIDSGLELLGAFSKTDGVLITALGLLDLLVVHTLDILIDARLQKYQVTPDLRRLARLTIGLGPGFSAGDNCDVAIETQPAATGRIILSGATAMPDRVPRRLANHGSERFVYSAIPGRWHTAVEIGMRVFKNYLIGNLGGEDVVAPFDGILRGVVRDGTEVPAGVKLLEIDGRGRQARFTGVDSRGRAIARAVVKAIDRHATWTSVPAADHIHLVH